MNKSYLSLVLIVSGLFFICSQSAAADWELLGKNNLGTVYYDKYGAKQIPGNIVRVSVKVTYSVEGMKTVRESFPFIAASETISHTLYTYELKCFRNSFTITRATTYNASGKAIKGTELDYFKAGEMSWDHVTPGSLVSALSNRACRYLLPGRP